LIRILITAFALVTATLAHAEDGDPALYKQFQNGWMVRIGKSQCLAARSYESGDILYIAYDAETNLAVVSVSDPDATSLKDGQEVKLHVIFIGNERLDTGWGVRDFKVFKEDSSIMMMGSFDARDMLRDVARNDIIALSIDGTAERLVGAYNLDGSSAAIDALRRCSFEVKGLNPNDPFLR